MSDETSFLREKVRELSASVENLERALRLEREKSTRLQEDLDAASRQMAHFLELLKPPS